MTAAREVGAGELTHSGLKIIAWLVAAFWSYHAVAVHVPDYPFARAIVICVFGGLGIVAVEIAEFVYNR